MVPWGVMAPGNLGLPTQGDRPGAVPGIQVRPVT